jgi:hypothetical protein
MIDCLFQSETKFTAVLRPDSSSEDRKVLYQTAWEWGFRREVKKRKGWQVSFVQRRREVDIQGMRQALMESKIVSNSWKDY